MLLSRRKIQNIQQMFSVPYRPTLSSFQSEKEDLVNFSNYLNNYISTGRSSKINLNKSGVHKSILNSKTQEMKKSSFPSYNYNYNDYTNYKYTETVFYPLRDEIIINNPEEVIRSGCLKGSVRQKTISSQMGDNNFNDNPMNQSQNMNTNMNIGFNNNEEEGKTFGQKLGDFKDSMGEKIQDFQDSAGQKFEEVKESAGQKFEEVKESAGQKFSEIGDSVQTKYGEAKDNIQDKLGNAKDSVQNTFEDIQDSTKQKLGDIGDSVQQKYNDIKDSVGDKLGEMKESVEEKVGGNNDDTNIDKIIPGKLTETINLASDGAKETAAAVTGTAAAVGAAAAGATETATEAAGAVAAGDTALLQKSENPAESTQEVAATPAKKYPITTTPNSVVSLPENYSTDDEDEFNAIKILNEDLSAWKLYTDKEDIKVWFKSFPTKDEKGEDTEGVIGYTEATLNIPASKLITNLNDFNFRTGTDEQYKKGKLISESNIDGNIKVMILYLYMKMPFIFSDRDFVVQKKCWLDYNGNKDHALFYMHSVENSEYPAKDKPVRGTYVNRSGYVKPLGDNQCKINVVTCMDIKLNVGVERMSKSGAEMQESWIKALKKKLA
jgi:gas vesicle protein